MRKCRRAAGRPAREVIRIEAVAEAVAKSGDGAKGFADAFRAELVARSRTAVGLKTIVAYRCTFKIDQTVPSDNEIAQAPAIG